MVSHRELTIAVVLVTFALPAWADPALFEKIHKRNVIEIVLPGGECEARVVRRALDELTVKLKSSTSACGSANALMTLSRSNLRDVVDDRGAMGYGPRRSGAGQCAAIGSALIVPAGIAVGILTRSPWASLGIFTGGGVATGILCNKATRYTVFVEQIDRAP